MLRDSYFINNFDELDQLVQSRIKSKAQIIQILITSMKIVLTDFSTPDENIGQFSIKDEGIIKRIYFTILDKENKVMKHFSFIFPFSIIITEKTINFKLVNRDIMIDLYILEILNTLSKNNWFSDSNENNYDSFTAFEHYIDLIGEFSPDQATEAEIWSVIQKLLTFEPGYLRYDYDLENFKDKVHPLHHLDVNYSEIGTFKLGLQDVRDRLEFNNFEDIVLNGKSRQNHCYHLIL